MTKRLDNSDRAAIDMLFDRITAASNGGTNGGSYVGMTTAVADERIQSVEKILSLLSQMPAPEASPDLAVRTLQRVAQASGAKLPTMPGTMPFDPAQPMA